MTFCFASSLDAESRYEPISMTGIVLVIAMMLHDQMRVAILTIAATHSMALRHTMDT